jgi:hypothetical protein
MILGSISVAVVHGEAAGALGTMTAPSTNTTASYIERLRLMVAPSSLARGRTTRMCERTASPPPGGQSIRHSS